MKGFAVCLTLGLLCGFGAAVDSTAQLRPPPVVTQGPVLRGMARGSGALLAVALAEVDTGGLRAAFHSSTQEGW